jgi:hypothetical protein
MRLCAVIGPPHSVHGSPWTSPGVHWVQASLAHNWRTIATPCVLPEDNVRSAVLEALGDSGPRSLRGRRVRPATLKTQRQVLNTAGGSADSPSCGSRFAHPRRRRAPRGPSLASGEPEGAALGVPADRPPLARVDDLAAQFLDADERLRDVGDVEVGKREAVAGPGPALVQPERNSAFPRLSAASLSLLALDERDAQQPLPEPTSALWVVRGKLDKRQLDHAAMVPLYRHGGGKGPAVTLVADQTLASVRPSPYPDGTRARTGDL